MAADNACAHEFSDNFFDPPPPPPPPAPLPLGGIELLDSDASLQSFRWISRGMGWRMGGGEGDTHKKERCRHPGEGIRQRAVLTQSCPCPDTSQPTSRLQTTHTQKEDKKG